MEDKFHGNINHKITKKILNREIVLEKKYFKNTEQSNRFNRELKFYNFCEKNNIKNVPKLFEYSDNTLIIEYINGSAISNVNESNLFFFSNFLNKLNNPKTKYLINDLPIAAEAILESKDLLINLEKRIEQVGLNGKYHPPEFEKIANSILNNAIKINHDIGPIIANPSDFGVHNSLFYMEKIFFFDFEYSGKDSLLKCIMDFVLHPANKINITDIDKIVQSFSSAIGTNDFKILDLTKKCFFLWWVLRLLNSISDNSIEEKIKCNLISELDKLSFINQRLQNINKFYNYIT
jgi:hypothetical protein